MAGRLATYRIQLTPQFGFDAARAIVPDVARLGVSHLYLSPVAEAVPGSTHGYDVTDPEAVRDELGGRGALWSLAEAAGEHGLSLLVDIVPNHISSHPSPRNRWWWELLRDGRDASTEEYFDVDWESGDGRILLPFLGGPLDQVIDDGEWEISEDRASVRHRGRRYPLRASANQTELAAVLDDQAYRLTAEDSPERNVRRFFAVDELVGIRPEVPAVAQALHRTVLDLEADQLLAGVRLDHIDGLSDPTAYLRGLRIALGDDAWILVEKIVVGDEQLSPDWQVDGTTGYEWITLVDHVFTNPAGEATFTRLWRDASGDELDYHGHEEKGIREVLRSILRPEVERLARCAADEAGRHGSTLDASAFTEPIIESTVHLGRYRTYLGSRENTAEEEDLRLVRAAAAAARARLGQNDALDVFVTTVERGGTTTRRWQQLSGPALAKGGEDQALYRFLRLAAHNEVGGDPGHWTTSVEAFHEHNSRVVEHHPQTLLAGSTHDTKRSEDVRARLLALTEFPEEWASAFGTWRERIAHLGVGGCGEALALQTAVGAWPVDETRLGDYLVKASREAGLDTTWARRNEAYESSLRALATSLASGEIASAIAAFVDRIEPTAHSIALAQLVLRLTSPGVPDIYQCSESWLHTLVDPDNRRPLDPADLRSAADSALAGGSVWESSAPKAAVIARLLATRRRNSASFDVEPAYRSLRAAGAHHDHVIAYERGPNVTVVASRFPASRPDGWAGTAVDVRPGAWRDVLSDRGVDGGRLQLTDLLGHRPAAVLERLD